MKIKSLEHYYVIFRRWLIRPILLNKKLSYFLYRHCLKVYLALFYENWTGKILNYHEPSDLNQALMKLSWKNSCNPKMRRLIPLCVDKYEVRNFISSHGYENTLNELYGVYDSVDDIDFEALPNQFVMKMNNACGRNFICTNKSNCNWENIKNLFENWLKDTNFGWEYGEWQYALIKPKIIVEKYLKDLGEKSLIDYKAHVINGKVVNFFVCYNRELDITKSHPTVCFDAYDNNWNRTDDIKPDWYINRLMITAPTQLQEMIKMAEDCCREFSYCRFDMYEIEGKIVFGEMTFTPHGNVLDYYTDEYLNKMKNYLLLS